jgi:hypothetical protein
VNSIKPELVEGEMQCTRQDCPAFGKVKGLQWCSEEDKFFSDEACQPWYKRELGRLQGVVRFSKAAEGLGANFVDMFVERHFQLMYQLEQMKARRNEGLEIIERQRKEISKLKEKVKDD